MDNFLGGFLINDSSAINSIKFTVANVAQALSKLSPKFARTPDGLPALSFINSLMSYVFYYQYCSTDQCRLNLFYQSGDKH